MRRYYGRHALIQEIIAGCLAIIALGGLVWRILHLGLAQ